MRIYLFIFFLLITSTLSASNALIDSLFNKMNQYSDAEKDFHWQDFTSQLNDSIVKITTDFESHYLKTNFLKESNQLVFGGVVEFEHNKPRLVWGVKNLSETNNVFIFYNEIDFQTLTPENKDLIIDSKEFSIDENIYNQLFFTYGENLVYDVIDIELKLSFQRIVESKYNREKEELSEKIEAKLVPLLNDESLFDDKFIGLEKLSTLVSNDKNLKICTWNIQLRNGIQKMYGAVVTRQDIDSKISVTLLNDDKENIKSPERAQLSPQKWFGAVYYDIIEVEHKKDTHYILLGYNGNNLFTKIRVVEVIKIMGNNRVVFGSPIFMYERATKRRVVFEYSSRVNMMLRYDPKVKMIVFDNLEPAEPMHQGDFRYYGPDFTYNGFSLKNGKWNYVAEIDLRNPSTKKRRR